MKKIFITLIVLCQFCFSDFKLEKEIFIDITNEDLKSKVEFFKNNDKTEYLYLLKKQDEYGNFNSIIEKNISLKNNSSQNYEYYFLDLKIDNMNKIYFNGNNSSSNFTIDYNNSNSLILDMRRDGLIDSYKLYFLYHKEIQDFILEKVYFLEFGEFSHELRSVYLIQNERIKNITLKKFDINSINKFLYDNFLNKEILLAKKIKSKEMNMLYKNVANKPQEYAEELLDCPENNDNRDEDCGVLEKYFFEDDIAFSNNIAYFLIKAEFFKESIPILEKIIEKFPNRTVAYLNLADAYNGVGNKEKAKLNYEKYINLMKQDGKESKIPQRVLEFK